ncbi:3'-5' exoribonuclease [Pelomonas cellulosilytica]|uniref:3'-5' exoribonuclease n=1 Tax=Pelomonas cellulosilytica TaxID=2906762 RepID=A0ABS8XS85_9BURK|nr:3'-5' exoribonuclease [Pelomonas sp. P8]
MSNPEALAANWGACDGWQPEKGPRSPWKTRYFLDTEFTDFESFQLISVAIVGEDGREFYAERTDFEVALCSTFTCEVVLPLLGRLPGRAMPSDQLREELLAWLLATPRKPKPVLCYDFEGDVDLVERLLGGALPRGWKLENIEQKIDAARRAAFLTQQGGEHHALQDARANARAFL